MASLPSSYDQTDRNNESKVQPDDVATLKRAQVKRKGKRISATVTINKIDANTDNISVLSALEDKLTGLGEDLLSLDEEIQELMLSSSSLDDAAFLNESYTCENVKEEILIAIKKVQVRIASLKAAEAAKAPPDPNKNSNNNSNKLPGFNPSMSLPKLEMPKFNSNPLHFTRFISEFESIIDKTSYSEFQKFKLLEQSLSGEAKALVTTSGLHSMTYSAARAILDKAYDNSEAKQFAVVEDFLKLNLKEEEPFYWLSEAKALREQVNYLNMTKDSFVLYFLWRGLPEKYKDQFIAITRKTQPNVNDLMDNFFSVNHRIKSKGSQPGTESQSNDQQTLTMSTVSEKSKPQNQKRNCVYCSNSAHAHASCPKYTSPSARVQRLKALSRCELCTSDHATKDCKFKFRYNCSKCKGKHFSSLCNKQRVKNQQVNQGGTAPSSATTNNSSEVHTGVTLTHSSGACDATNVILPSFTATIESPSGRNAETRVWKDSCAQSTLIEEKLANELKLETEEELSLTLKGAVSSRTYKTRKVKVPIRLKNSVHNIIASVVPKIDISLELPRLDRVVGEFSGRGYEIADKHLRGPKVQNGQILLGSEHAYLIPVSTISFGQSSCLSSQEGILLEGDIDKIIGDLKHLQSKPPDQGANRN